MHINVYCEIEVIGHSCDETCRNLVKLKLRKCFVILLKRFQPTQEFSLPFHLADVLCCSFVPLLLPY